MHPDRKTELQLPHRDGRPPVRGNPPKSPQHSTTIWWSSAPTLSQLWLRFWTDPARSPDCPPLISIWQLLEILVVGEGGGCLQVHLQWHLRCNLHIAGVRLCLLGTIYPIPKGMRDHDVVTAVALVNILYDESFTWR